MKQIFNRPITVLMFTLTILVFGFISAAKLPVSLMPDTEKPIISIITRYHGVGAEQIEKLITIPIENAVSTISNIKEIRAASEDGKSVVIVYFENQTKMKYAALNISEAVERVAGTFPKAAHKPYFIRNKPDDKAVFIFSLQSDFYHLNKLRDLAEHQYKEELMQLNGVAEAVISGGSITEIQVNIDKDTLASHQIPLLNVPEVIASRYFIQSGGKLFEHKQEGYVHTDSRFKTVQEIAGIPIHIEDKNKSLVYLKDVASVKENPREPDTYSRLNGQDCVTIYIRKNSTANTLEVCTAILQYLESLKNEPHLEITEIFNEKEYIQKAINNVLVSAVLGTIIASIVLFLFFNDFKAIGLIAFSIPFSLFFTFFMMYLTDLKINIMTLSGLAIGIGMLLDNGIIMIKQLNE
ncbi:MAG: efflux RND transporter permease subunit, partial [Spirochaetes bacterium]|nr:efflux RND transporter permease subunit [Spirochaetota bacterium]